MCAFGIFFAFFGNKFVSAVIFLAGAVVGFAATLWFVFVLLDAFDVKQTDWMDWVALAGSALVGVGVGYGLMRCRKIGFGLLAAWGGVFLGFLITTTFFVKDVWAYWGVIIACAVGAGVLTIYVEKHVMIVLTSFVGSYAAIRGISLYAGDFPPETSIHQMLADGDVTWSNFPKVFYGYIAGILVLTGLSAVFQYKHQGDAPNHPYHKRK